MRSWVLEEMLQMTRLRTPNVDIIAVYRSQGANSSELINDLQQIVRPTTPTIICGDFNLCFVNQRNCDVIQMLYDQGFQQLVSEASHIQGGHIDHVYSNLDPKVFQVEVMMYSPYYTYHDHDAFCITVVERKNKE